MEKYLKDKLPTDLKKEFEQEYSLSLEQILDALYNKPYPNRFLASFSEFISPRRHHPFLHNLVRSSFEAFFEEQVKKYKEWKTVPISFVGSVAFYYEDILLEVAKEQKIKVGRILKSPMEGLIEFHSLHRI
jgi:archaellum biogenesis protein FlaJ (TadC family)